MEIYLIFEFERYFKPPKGNVTIPKSIINQITEKVKKQVPFLSLFLRDNIGSFFTFYIICSYKVPLQPLVAEKCKQI